MIVLFAYGTLLGMGTTHYSKWQTAIIPLAAMAGCALPGAAGAWYMRNAYQPSDVFVVCALAPVTALCACMVSIGALFVIGQRPLYLKKDAPYAAAAPILVAWLLSTAIAPAGALVLLFSALGSMCAAIIWRSVEGRPA